MGTKEISVEGLMTGMGAISVKRTLVSRKAQVQRGTLAACSLMRLAVSNQKTRSQRKVVKEMWTLSACWHNMTQVCIDRYCGNVLHRSYGGGEQGKHYVAPSTTLGRPKVRYGHQIILVMFRNKSASLSTANPPKPPPRIYIFGCFGRINIAQHQSFSLPQLKPFGLCIPLSNPTNLSCLIF